MLRCLPSGDSAIGCSVRRSRLALARAAKAGRLRSGGGLLDGCTKRSPDSNEYSSSEINPVLSGVGSTGARSAGRGSEPADRTVLGEDTAEDVAQPVRIDLLAVDDSPRLEGVDMDHVHALAEAQGQLPPILVHRGTMKVIDGRHRLMAAELQGCSTVEVCFFDGSEDEAFVKSVQANVAHGLPLTLADRTAAAARIVKAHAEWSDRRIAVLVGLSPKTVGAVRMRSTEEIPQSQVRVGRDGRVRRLPARKPGNKRPAAPEGESKADTGTGKAGERGDGRERRSRAPAGRSAATSMETLQALRQDPAFRLTDTGRFLLRLLDLHLNQVREWNRLIAHVPPHRANSVANLARECSQTWREFAEQVSAQSSALDMREPATT